MADTNPAREGGDQPSVLVPEEVLDQRRRGQDVDSSRTSMLEPGLISPGLARATSSASSRLSAAMIMNPPTTSFTSTKGPSVTPAAPKILPPGISFPPMSKMLSLYFSFQALKDANISCIWAGDGGEGGSPVRRGLR